MYRKGVSALIINKNEEFLLVNLVSFEDKYFTIPGGGVEDDETLEDAVYREAKEELGIEKSFLEFVGKSNLPHKFKYKVIKVSHKGKEYVGSERHFFGFRFIGNNDEIKYLDGEVRTHEWVSFPELKDYLLFDNQLETTIDKMVEVFSSFR